MGAGDGAAELQTREFHEHLGPADDRDVGTLSFESFNVFAGSNGRRVHHNVGTGNMPRIMTVVNFSSKLLKMLGGFGTMKIRAADGKTLNEQNLGNARHANAADANEMDIANGGEVHDEEGRESFGQLRLFVQI
jgi:hypothetical protein